MTAGPYTALNAVSLSAAEKVSGYTASANATQGGPDVAGLFESAKQDLLAAQSKLTAIVAVLPSGSNKTAINAQLTILSATS